MKKNRSVSLIFFVANAIIFSLNVNASNELIKKELSKVEQDLGQVQQLDDGRNIFSRQVLIGASEIAVAVSPQFLNFLGIQAYHVTHAAYSLLRIPITFFAKKVDDFRWRVINSLGYEFWQKTLTSKDFFKSNSQYVAAALGGVLGAALVYADPYIRKGTKKQKTFAFTIGATLSGFCWFCTANCITHSKYK